MYAKRESLISLIEEIVQASENNNKETTIAAYQPKLTQFRRIQRKPPLTQQKPTLVDVLHHLRMAVQWSKYLFFSIVLFLLKFLKKGWKEVGILGGLEEEKFRY